MAYGAVLDFVEDEIRIFFNYHGPTVHALKSASIDARWDEAGKYWAVPEEHAQEVFELLDSLRYMWEVRRKRVVSWSDQALLRCPERLRLSLFTAIADVLHPGHGGDAEMMRELSTSWRAVRA